MNPNASPTPGATAFASIDPRTMGKVAVLLGGFSAEREVSLMSGQGVLAALQRSGVAAHAFDPAERELWQLKAQGFERAFITLHGRFGEDGTVQGALELMGIPYTGPGVLSSSLSMDKIMSKRLWRAEGLPTPDWRQVRSGAETEAALAALGAPMIVKPAREGSTIGLSKISHASECAQAYALAAQCDPEVLCEQYIAGDEVTVALLGQGEAAQALPLIRIQVPGGNYDYEHKYFSDETQYLIPSGLPAAEEAAIQQLALQAYQSLDCRGWSRVDVMIAAATRRPYLLELNSSPGMTGHSLVPMAARAVGLSYEALCLQVLASASLDNPLPAARPGNGKAGQPD